MAHEESEAPAVGDSSPHATRFGHGFCWQGENPRALSDALDAAFDYRGDVTLFLHDGSALEGFLSNREPSGDEPFVEVFPKAGGGKTRILYRDIKGLAFTGKDPASGKSWETWVKKYTAKRAAEARGESVESIDLYPDEL